jgi:hypothetical protein
VLTLFLVLSLAVPAQETAAEQEERRIAEFLADLRTAIEKNDRTRVSQLVAYPLRWNGKRRSQISTPEELLKYYDRIFSYRFRLTIEGARAEDVFRNDQGWMWDSGRFWIDSSENGVFRIITVNEPTLHAYGSTPLADVHETVSYPDFTLLYVSASDRKHEFKIVSPDSQQVVTWAEGAPAVSFKIGGAAFLLALRPVDPQHPPGYRHLLIIEAAARPH